MTRTLVKLALSASLAILASPSDVFAGRGGGGGGGMQRGGGSYGGGGMNHSPSFSQPHPQSNGSASGNRNSSSNYPNAGAANRNQSGNPSNAGAAAAGAGYANRNQQPNHPNAAPAAAGAGYANRNQQGNYPNAGAAAVGAGYANRNQYGNYYGGAGYGTWNGNYGAGMGGYPYGGMGVGMGGPAVGGGSMPYMNPYAAGGPGVGGASGAPAQPANVPASNAPAANTAPIDYSQPLNTAAAPPAPAPDAPASDPGTSPAGQARQAFQTGDYLNALKLTNQALGQSPNDANLHQFLALDLFAQGNYEQAAAPLYAVLSAGPGWNWTTLIGNYSDADAYTQQLRGLEAFVKANPKSAKAQFVLAYQYICQGQGEAAIKPLKNVVSLQPNDKLSARLLAMLQPPGGAPGAPTN